MRMSIEEIDCDMFQFNQCAVSNIKQVETAIKLYKGMPFENKDYAWANPLQAEYKVEYIRLLSIACAHYKKEANRTMLQYYNDKLNLAMETQG